LEDIDTKRKALLAEQQAKDRKREKESRRK